MPLPQRLDPTWLEEQLCNFAVNWVIDATLAIALGRMAKIVQFSLMMVSGWRSITEQLNTKDGADPAVSTHTSCPFATGADLQIVGWNKQTTPIELRRAFGAAAQLAGLRWGGGSKVDPQTGIPSDWNHVDLGPRVR